MNGEDGPVTDAVEDGADSQQIPSEIQAQATTFKVQSVLIERGLLLPFKETINPAYTGLLISAESVSRSAIGGATYTREGSIFKRGSPRGTMRLGLLRILGPDRDPSGQGLGYP